MSPRSYIAIVGPLLLLMILLIVLPAVIRSSPSIYSLPVYELEALQDLYNNTGGNNWRWRNTSMVNGYRWNFTTSAPQSNPCSASYPWQGISCSSTCETQPCNIKELILTGYNLTGVLPSTLVKLSNLTTLRLDINRLDGTLPESLGHLLLLNTLNLSINHITGTIPSSFGNNLKVLKVLSLFGNHFNGTIPSSLSNLSSLEVLQLNLNQLHGPIPESFGKLITLEYLYLSRNKLSNTIPNSLGNVTTLVNLYLDLNHLTGTIPESLGYLNNLKHMNLSVNHLEGTIPESFSSLSGLEVLHLFENRLNGTIPASLSQLTNLQVLLIYLNLLTGNIPGELSNLTSLQKIYVFQNFLTGTIPEALGNFKSMVNFQLHMNEFTGTIPATLGSMETVGALFLYMNQLSGTIPETFSKLNNLWVLYLYDNHLSGTIPEAFGNLSSLEKLYLNQNRLTGTIPESLGNLKLLWVLFLHENQFYGVIPESFCNLTALQFVGLNNNFLSGTIPVSLGNMTDLTHLELNQNLLTGSIPLSLGQVIDLIYLELFQNELTGPIFRSSWRFLSLFYFSVGNNLLTGTIPSSLNDSIALETFDAFGNFLTSNIPSTTINSWKILKSFDVSQNFLSGTLSEGLFDEAIKLTTVILSENMLSGRIPYSLFQGPTLFSVILAVNCFSGTLPDSICTSPILTQLILDGLHSSPACSTKAIIGLPSSGLIAKNSVYGNIPSCLLQLPYLSVLHMGGNSFSGLIPNVPITKSMNELILSGNQLTGSIPISVWQSNITTLDLSLNRFQGTLPSDMLLVAQSLTMMNNATIKLQVNQLAGPIPTWLQTLPAGNIHILEGNMFSCNTDRSDIPPNDPKSETYQCGSDNTNYGLIAFGVAFLFASTITGLYRCYLKLTLRRHVLAFFRLHYLDSSEVRKAWQQMQTTVCIIAGMVLLSMVIFGILSIYFASYADIYVWVVSAIYKTGLTPTLIMLFWFILFLIITILSIQRITPSKESTLSHIRTSIHRNSLTKAIKVVSQTKMIDIIAVCTVFIINIVAVVVVNGMYVYFIVNVDYSFRILLIIAFCLSLFKIAWNVALLRSSHYVDKFSDNMIVWLSLFNNLAAPLVAELFVSSDCFLYIVSEAPALIFDYQAYTCQEENLLYYVVNICSVPVLLNQGFGTSVQVSIIPPFHYSYQCSFSLISSYAYVFIVRYVISGLIEPVMRVLVYHFLQYSSGFYFSGVVRICLKQLLSPISQTIVELESSMQDKDQFLIHLEQWEMQVEAGMFRRRLVAVFSMDIAMIIGFGALFPPLAIIIALSVVKDVMSIRVALSRYCEIMELLEDDRLKEKMRHVKKSMDIEMLKARTGIWHGVWHGTLMGTWIWAFVLFDTMASKEGVLKGMSVLIVMLVIPFLLEYGIRLNVWFEKDSSDCEIRKTVNRKSNTSERVRSVSTISPLVLSISGLYGQTRSSIVKSGRMSAVNEGSHIELTDIILYPLNDEETSITNPS